MLWHWVFSLTAGVLAGWSLAHCARSDTDGAGRGHLLRGLLSLAAMAGFTYSGWQMGQATALMTLAVCVCGAGVGYLLGRLRTAQNRLGDGNASKQSASEPAPDQLED